MKNSNTRKKLYLKLANRFLTGKEDAGFCNAFIPHTQDDSFFPEALVKEYPELVIAFTTLSDKGKYGLLGLYGEIGNVEWDKAGWEFRATLLCFAAVLCDEEKLFDIR